MPSKKIPAKQNDKFSKLIRSGYEHKGESIDIGAAMLGESCFSELAIKLPLKTMNRHGLIAGATGTGKTKTLQLIAAELSASGIPSLLMDIKGDLSGIGAKGAEGEGILQRASAVGTEFVPRAYPVEFLSLSREKGTRLRATISEFGSLLLSRLLELSDVQTGALAAIFKYCDDNGLLLLDLPDIKKALHFAAYDGRAALEEEYGRISPSTVGAIIRKLAALEQEGADLFFGEPSFDIGDLMRFDENGSGIVSIVRLADMQSKPMLFSTFMLQMLAELYEKLPEEGDLDRPKLVVFIDEAHLIFKRASPTLIDQIEMMVKLIRSKGVGIFFCTQNPDDIPAGILSQLGLKVQHSLRAFTARDRKAIKKASENFPISEFYDASTLLTSMGTGEAMVTTLNEKGRPTPLMRTLLRPPLSRMGILKPGEIQAIVGASSIAERYKKTANRKSAYEILSNKAEAFGSPAKSGTMSPARTTRKKVKADESTLETIIDSTIARQVGRTVARELTRGLLGIFGLGGRRRRR